MLSVNGPQNPFNPCNGKSENYFQTLGYKTSAMSMFHCLIFSFSLLKIIGHYKQMRQWILCNSHVKIMPILVSSSHRCQNDTTHLWSYAESFWNLGPETWLRSFVAFPRNKSRRCSVAAESLFSTVDRQSEVNNWKKFQIIWNDWSRQSAKQITLKSEVGWATLNDL